MLLFFREIYSKKTTHWGVGWMYVLYTLIYWRPYPGLTALLITLLKMVPLATYIVCLSAWYSLEAVCLQSYSYYSWKKSCPLLGALFIYFHCLIHYSKDLRTIRETDIACSSMANKLILIKRLSLFILFIEVWNAELTSLTAFTSTSFKIMDKIEHFFKAGIIS